MPKLDTQISTLEEKLKQLKLRQQRIEARRKSIESKRERKADTRRKILIGAIVQAKVKQKIMDEKLLRGWLDEALTRSDDRALIDLPPRAATPRSHSKAAPRLSPSPRDRRSALSRRPWSTPLLLQLR